VPQWPYRIKEKEKDMQYTYSQWTEALEIAEESNFTAGECGRDYPLAAWISDLLQNGAAKNYGPNVVEAALHVMIQNRVKSFSQDAVLNLIRGYQGETGDDFVNLAEEYAEEGGDIAVTIMETMARQSGWSDGDYESWYLANVRPEETYAADSDGTLHWFTKSAAGI
jgi:hypothetical protein